MFSQVLSVSHGHSPMMSTMTGQHGRLGTSSPIGGGSPSATRQKLTTTRGGTRQKAPPSDYGPPLPPRNKK